MSELQNDVVESDLNESNLNEVENQDTGAELATASEAEHEAQPQVDEEAKKQEAIQKVINEKTFKAKQAEREAAEYKQKLDEYEAKQREQLAQQVGDIPPMPDAFDDDYEEKVRVRDAAIAKQAEYNSQQQAYLRQQQFQQQQEAQQKAVKIQESMTAYSNKALELGIKPEELQAAGNTVASYGLSDELVMHILSEKDGPLITKHLAANPQDGFELANMSPYAVGTFLDGIKQKAGALKPKQSKAPTPADNLQGKGVDPDEGRYKHIKGAKIY